MSVANTEIEPNKLSKEQLVNLSEKAIDNARKKAEALATKIDKTIGEVVAVVDQNTSAAVYAKLWDSTSQTHTVTVSFELK